MGSRGRPRPAAAGKSRAGGDDRRSGKIPRICGKSFSGVSPAPRRAGLRILAPRMFRRRRPAATAPGPAAGSGEGGLKGPPSGPPPVQGRGGSRGRRREGRRLQGEEGQGAAAGSVPRNSAQRRAALEAEGAAGRLARSRGRLPDRAGGGSGNIAPRSVSANWQWQGGQAPPPPAPGQAPVRGRGLAAAGGARPNRGAAPVLLMSCLCLLCAARRQQRPVALSAFAGARPARRPPLGLLAARARRGRGPCRRCRLAPVDRLGRRLRRRPRLAVFPYGLAADPGLASRLPAGASRKAFPRPIGYNRPEKDGGPRRRPLLPKSSRPRAPESGAPWAATLRLGFAPALKGRQRRNMRIP
jgi:hypothetical protein